MWHGRIAVTSRSVAKRVLRFRHRMTRQEGEIWVSISEPKPVDPSSVSFEVNSETAECTVSIEGLPEPVTETTYGADSVQALRLGSDIDPLLKRVAEDYELFFASGEPYFEGTNEDEQSAT